MLKRYFYGLQSLPKKDIRKIQKQISIDTDKIKARHKEFVKEYPDGKVPVASLFEGESEESRKDLLKIMDTDGNGKIDFKEFIVCMGMLESISQELTKKNLTWMFKAFDFDNSGTMCRKEFLALSKIIAGDEGLDEKHILRVFNKLDTNIDNELNLDEFVDGMLQIVNDSVA